MELGLGRCLARVGTDWTVVRTFPPPAAPKDDPTLRVVAATERRAEELKSESSSPAELLSVEDLDEQSDPAEFVQ